ncbi:1,5-anhydro-D-fructose reductase [Rubripirellula amarantea]|uniref:1,5-anhydro-D-fructose reductase n=1 Tax=Rubripirellula amarantea TaxID=2527999 RepID=A0A5C5WPZ5_9BACT|nr:Gfo/Idh/MocA family oxidoreductase [Rubripirellula amarantea]TWT52758.1 1,5-anhydro-D-fructose reductase [Rubripirellula amarantea]
MKLNAAVVGTGFIGPVHVEALKRIGVNVKGIVGSSPEKSIAASEDLNLPGRYESIEDVLRDDNVDVVHLATPNKFHFDQTKLALAAGKHVLCEKPLAMNSQQSAELVRIANESGLVTGVAYNIRFYPLCHEAAARISQSNFGETLHVTGSYVQDWLLKQSDFNWRVVAGEGGDLRAVADIGTHWLDLVQFITGQSVVSVCADLQTVHSTRYRAIGATLTFSGSENATETETEAIDINTEDAGCILLKFANGARGSLHVSQTTAGRKNCLRFEIAGSHQALSWNSEQPNSLWVGYRDRPAEMLIRDPATMSPSAAAIASYPGGHAEGFPDTFKQLFQTFYNYIADGDFAAPRQFPTFDDGHREVMLCEAILKSHREQAWVDVAHTA